MPTPHESDGSRTATAARPRAPGALTWKQMREWRLRANTAASGRLAGCAVPLVLSCRVSSPFHANAIAAHYLWSVVTRQSAGIFPFLPLR